MTDLTQLNSLNFPIESIVMLSLYFIIGIYTIFTAIFYYHWKTYATDTKVTAYTIMLYFATTIPLLIIMTILAFVIT